MIRLTPRPAQFTILEDKRRFRSVVAGRRFGKTYLSAMEMLVHGAGRTAQTIYYVAPTFALAKDVQWEPLKAMTRPLWKAQPNESELYIDLTTGSRIRLRGADKPDRLRGPGIDFLVLDEFADIDVRAWNTVLRPALADKQGRALFIGTPKGRNHFYDIHSKGEANPETWGTYRFTTLDGGNVTQAEIEQARRDMPERMFRQEYLATFEDPPGALWTWEMLDTARVLDRPRPPCGRVVVAIDPAVSSTDASDETGIVVAGIDHHGMGSVIEDASGIYTPDQWAAKAVALYERYRADRIVAEVNNGGDLVERSLRVRAPYIAYTPVRATRGKYLRAEPIAALYEQALIRHYGRFEKLEEQMTTYTPESTKSPDRLDALVWALTSLYTESSESLSRIEVYDEPVQISPF